MKHQIISFAFSLAFPVLIFGQELPARKVVFPDKVLTLKKALNILSQQSDIPVLDNRLSKPTQKIRFANGKITFWQALEKISQAAGAGISPYKEISLVDGKADPLVAIQGPFRAIIRRIGVTRDLQTGVHQCQVNLEVAWEPWFEPFFMELRSFTVDGKSYPGNGRFSVHGKPTGEEVLAFPAPPRSTTSIDTLNAKLFFVGPVEMRNLVFEGLNKVNQKPIQKSKDGVSVTLKRFSKIAKDFWEAELILEHPAGGPKFESFQTQTGTWLLNNKIYLQNRQDKSVKIYPLRGFTPIGKLTSNYARIVYAFNNKSLSNPSDWNLFCRTPGRLIEAGINVEFKGLPLP